MGQVSTNQRKILLHPGKNLSERAPGSHDSKANTGIVFIYVGSSLLRVFTPKQLPSTFAYHLNQGLGTTKGLTVGFL
ncbi:hypothetical protein INT44_005648 [Umbelopsis vinacea]|uniref:Uncharacterized protein n=1 Tax=Umbelopsis vinacea TaxID=44442 RepID=A0A8H7PXX1_9FUNG|nr:hypothetical protein INT44_005648 [Umbelopsis vinacea]